MPCLIPTSFFPSALSLRRSPSSCASVYTLQKLVFISHFANRKQRKGKQADTNRRQNHNRTPAPPPQKKNKEKREEEKGSHQYGTLPIVLKSGLRSKVFTHRQLDELHYRPSTYSNDKPSTCSDDKLCIQQKPPTYKPQLKRSGPTSSIGPLDPTTWRGIWASTLKWVEQFWARLGCLASRRHGNNKTCGSTW